MVSCLRNFWCESKIFWRFGNPNLGFGVNRRYSVSLKTRVGLCNPRRLQSKLTDCIVLLSSDP
ncbi:hypothetical protein HanPI659440_Chr00c04g0711291 [Helianthus annuus]|nr:hypothetical protein HanPI659440_Chr00c04g0711291 [Helianthus annuus]